MNDPSPAAVATPKPGAFGGVAVPGPRLHRVRIVLLALAAGLPFLILWAVMNAAYYPITVRRGLVGAITAVGSAAILGIGVWWLSGRLRWPAKGNISGKRSRGSRRRNRMLRCQGAAAGNQEAFDERSPAASERRRLPAGRIRRAGRGARGGI